MGKIFIIFQHESRWDLNIYLLRIYAGFSILIPLAKYYTWVMWLDLLTKRWYSTFLWGKQNKQTNKKKNYLLFNGNSRITSAILRGRAWLCWSKACPCPLPQPLPGAAAGCYSAQRERQPHWEQASLGESPSPLHRGHRWDHTSTECLCWQLSVLEASTLPLWEQCCFRR